MSINIINIELLSIKTEQLAGRDAVNMKVSRCITYSNYNVQLSVNLDLHLQVLIQKENMKLKVLAFAFNSNIARNITKTTFIGHVN